MSERMKLGNSGKPTAPLRPSVRSGLTPSSGPDAFRVERHGDVAVVIPSSEVESLQDETVGWAVDLILQTVNQARATAVVVDLGEVEFFGTIFLSLLLRVWKSLANDGGTLVICNPSSQAREVLRITNLDTLWALYDDRDEAIAALEAE
ncbi:MAG: STAS domain-containing protein [Planctomycetia bacterium]